jgi:hypothetical protein
MKRLILITIISGNLFAQTNIDSTTVKPLPARKFNHIIKFGPLHLLANRFNIGYELFMPNHKVSFYISPTIYIVQNNNNSYRNNYSFVSSKTYGYAVDFQVRIYLGDTDFKKNPRARFNHLYLAPYGNLAYYTMSGTGTVSTYSNGYSSSSLVSYSNSVSASGGGFALGYQLFLFKNKVTLDAFFGGGVRFSYQANSNSFDVNSSSSNFFPPSGLFNNGDAVYSINYTGIVPRVGFQVGYTF